MPFSSKAVANAFINRALTDKKDITALKLQKLVYYANGYYLAARDAPLIDEKFEAWQYGPVVPSLYHEFKRFGSNRITRLAADYDFQLEDSLPVPPPSNDKVADLAIDFVWKHYGDLTGIQLSEMTHMQGTPWQKTQEKNTYNQKNVDIADNDIKEYFYKFTVRNSNA